MALFSAKTDAERAADAKRKAEAVYRASPQGMAAQAFERGDEFFQIEIPHSSVTGFTNAAFNSSTNGTIRRKLTRTDLLGQIEETGWCLEHADWVYIQTGQNSRDKFLASGQHVVVTGEVIGIYLFRRDESHATAVKAVEASNKSKSHSNGEARKLATATPLAEPSPTTRTMKCFKCQHSQKVSVSVETFTCEQCGTKLKRAT